ncbi:MAG: MBL fold metallo-hydrolase [Actinobacteria bacterium]|nr:MBL fold metallo-hydrolase [Actinomycetota bacterium]
MSDAIYQFKVGNFDCAAVIDGNFVYEPPMFPAPPHFLFVNAPEDRLIPALTKHGLAFDEWEGWTTPYTCLLVSAGGKRVLIDTGAGALGPRTGALVKNLGSLGVDPGAIDLVILTHAHPDHLGGNTAADGSVVFPKADWAMSKVEWDFWMGGQAEAVLPEHSKEILLGYARRNLGPIGDRVELVDGEKELLPGIKILPAPGHTPGHSAVAISSAREELLCLSDLVLHPLHLEEPEWFAGVDMLPDQLISSRRTLLGTAAQEQSLVMLFHFPFPGLGRVRPRAEGWQWEPQS